MSEAPSPVDVDPAEVIRFAVRMSLVGQKKQRKSLKRLRENLRWLRDHDTRNDGPNVTPIRPPPPSVAARRETVRLALSVVEKMIADEAAAS